MESASLTQSLETLVEALFQKLDSRLGIQWGEMVSTLPALGLPALAAFLTAWLECGACVPCSFSVSRTRRRILGGVGGWGWALISRLRAIAALFL